MQIFIACFASWNCRLNESMVVLSKVFKTRLFCSTMFNLAGLQLSLIIDQSECLICYFLCTELTLFCTELPENCIYLNQSELSNFSMYIISFATVTYMSDKPQGGGGGNKNPDK